MDDKDITDMVAEEAEKAAKGPSTPKRSPYKDSGSSFLWSPEEGRYVPKSRYPRSETNPLREPEQEALFPDNLHVAQDDSDLACAEHEFDFHIAHQGKKVIGGIAVCRNCGMVIGNRAIEALLKCALVMDTETLDFVADETIGLIGETIEAMQLREMAHWRSVADVVMEGTAWEEDEETPTAHP